MTVRSEMCYRLPLIAILPILSVQSSCVSYAVSAMSPTASCTHTFQHQRHGQKLASESPQIASLSRSVAQVSEEDILHLETNASDSYLRIMLAFYLVVKQLNLYLCCAL